MGTQPRPCFPRPPILRMPKTKTSKPPKPKKTYAPSPADAYPARPIILRNAVQCLKCDDIIESHHVHDFKYCSCGNIAVDGGREYLRRLGNAGNYVDLSEFEE